MSEILSLSDLKTVNRCDRGDIAEKGVTVVRPKQDDADSALLTLSSHFYHRFVAQNQDAVAYITNRGFQLQGRGFVALTPLWENRNNPKMTLTYISEARLSQVSLLELPQPNVNCFPRWYVSMGKIARSQLLSRLKTYNPETEGIIFVQVEDISQVFPIAEIYRQIHWLEIFTFTDFKSSITTCSQRFQRCAPEFSLY